MANRIPITAEYVRSRLDYDSETGIFVWRAINAVTRHEKIWNSKYAGTVAGAIDTKGRRQIKIDRVAYTASRLAWLIVKGVWPTLEIDHRNRTRDDNRFDNLREATSSQNSANMKTPVTNTSGYRGVEHLNSGSWRASINVRGQRKRLGCFRDLIDAAKAYDAAAAKFHGDFATLNFPP